MHMRIRMIPEIRAPQGISRKTMPNGIQKKRNTAAFTLLAMLLARMVTKRLNISPGKAMFNWLYAVGSQQPKRFLGSLENRATFGAWLAFLAHGLRAPDFLMKFQGTSDVWDKSKLVA